MSVFNLRITWSTSKGRDTYGYNICRLDQGGKRYRCIGGGYDMIGTVVGQWFADRHQDALKALVKANADKLVDCGYSVTGYKKLPDMYGLTVNPDGTVELDGACGIESMRSIIEACGFTVEWYGNKRGHTLGYLVYGKDTA